MIGVISLLVPPFLLSYIREKVIKKEESVYARVFHYALSVLFLNFVMILILCYGFDSRDNFFHKLNQYNEFALKYMLLSSILAVAEPYAEQFFRSRVAVKIKWSGCGWMKGRVNGKLVVGIYAAVLFLLNFIRIFDNNFWGDEAFSLLLVKKTIPDIIQGTAADVHPPLYYIFLRAAYVLFGDQGWACHMVSLIPCGLIIVFCMTAVWKTFGSEAAVLLITLACLSRNAVNYNMEVRMYSWGALFVLLAFYEMYRILRQERILHYVLFVLFSLAAAYTHYYCLLSVAFFYAVLLGLALFRRRLSVAKTTVSALCMAAGYMPWFVILFKAIRRVEKDYWIDSVPGLWQSLRYLFSSQFKPIVWGMVLLGVLLAILYETKVLRIERSTEGKITLCVSGEGAESSALFLWMVSGAVSILGTILAAVIVSKVMRPVYVLRYIYPVSTVAWMILAVSVARLKGKKIYTVLLLAYMLSVFAPAYLSTYAYDKSANKNLQETLAVTKEKMGEGDVILTDVYHMAWTIGPYYYPDIPVKNVKMSELTKLEKGGYWLIVEKQQEMGDTLERLKEQGFACEKVIGGGNLGTHAVDIYHLWDSGE